MKKSSSALDTARKSICLPLVFTAAISLYYIFNEPVYASDQPKFIVESTDGEKHSDHEEGWLQQQIRHFRSYPHLDRAYRLIKSERLSEALRELKQYLVINPQDVDARLSYVVVLYKLQRYKEVISATDALIEDQSGGIETLKYRAYAYQYLGYAEDAVSAFKVILRHDQASIVDRQFALDIIVDFYMAKEKYAEALSAYSQVIEGMKNFKQYYRLGVINDKLNRLNEAKSSYFRAYQLASENKDKFAVLLALGEIAKKRKSWQEAENNFSSAAKLDQKDTRAIREVANAVYQQEKYDTTVHWLRKALSIEENSADRKLLAHALYNLGQYSTAIQEYIKLPAETKDREMLYQMRMSLGYAYSRAGKNDRAEIAFDKALKLVKKDTKKYDIYLSLGDLARQRQGWAEAEKHYLAALNLQPLNTMPMRAMAEIAHDEGNYEMAADWLNRVLEIEPNQNDSEHLAYVLSALNNHEDAIKLFNNTLSYSPASDARYRILMSLGYEYLKNNQAKLALRAFSSAASIQRTPEALLSLARAQAVSGNIHQAEKLYDSLLKLDISSSTRADVLAGRGHIEYELGHHDQAVAAFRGAIEEGNNNWRTHQALGVSLYQQKKWEPALEQLQIASRINGNSKNFLYMALSYKQLGHTGAAMENIYKALINPEQLTRVELGGAYSELGYLYADSGQYRNAINAWDKSLSFHHDDKIILSRSRMYRFIGDLDKAQRDLENINETTLTRQSQLNRLNQLASIYAEKQQYKSATSSLLRAETLSTSADQQYRLGLYFEKLDDVENSTYYLEQAVSRKPNNSQYAASLGYLYMARGRYNEAVNQFESIVEREPDFPKIYQDLGYAQIRNVDNDAAVYWFKRGIDKQSSHSSQLNSEQGKIRQDIDGMRREISKLTNRYDFSLYQVYRSNSDDLQGAASPSLDGGATPSQGGIKFTYQPPIIGFRDDRIFQFFTRALWNTVPGTLEMSDESLQGGIGVRYKPLKTLGLFVGIEKLFEIGSNSIDDWLLRAQYSWDKKFVSDIKSADYYYLSVYGDLGFFSNSSPGRIFYWEAQLGKRFHFGPNFSISPHFIANGQYLNPDINNDSYTEAGLGISMQYPFGSSQYQASTSAVELRIQYKEKIEDQSSGWIITGVLHY